jgi:DNA-binding CsgD family transcriptional regulator
LTKRRLKTTATWRPFGSGATSTLTNAERAVARLVADGLTNAEIARARGAALRTIANQVAAILRKLGAASRGDVVRLAASGHGA